MNAARLERVLPGVWQWRQFSPEHKVELTSTAVRLNGSLVIFDPILLDAANMVSLAGCGEPEAIVLTNGNHERAVRWWTERRTVCVRAACDIPIDLSPMRRFESFPSAWCGWTVHRLSGGAPGEIALHSADLSLMIFGDAVVNLPGRALEILPAKYCCDQSRLREELRALLALHFENALTAHGSPVIGEASARIRQVLE